MSLLRRPRPLARLVAIALSLTSLFMVVFVAYAHLVSRRDAQLMLATGRVTHFISADSLSRNFDGKVVGGLIYDVSHEGLHVHGTAATASARAEFVGKEARLVESRLRLRFRATSALPFDIAVGAETAAETTHTIRLELSHDGDICEARLMGDTNALGPILEGDAVIATAAVHVCDTDWHELELRFSPELMRLIASIDGQPIFTPYASWDFQTLVRPLLFVQADRVGTPVDLLISEVTWTPVPLDLGATDVDDNFRGKIIDPFWRITSASSELVDATLTTGPDGLALHARSRTDRANETAFELTAPSAPLGSFSSSIELDVTTFSHAAFHLEIRNEPGPAWRRAQVGFLSTDNLSLVPFESGHFEQNGQARFRAFPEAAHPLGHTVLTFDYDARTQRARATFDGTPFFDEHLDLPPRSISYFTFGASVDEGGQADLRVQRARADHTRN